MGKKTEEKLRLVLKRIAEEKQCQLSDLGKVLFLKEGQWYPSKKFYQTTQKILFTKPIDMDALGKTINDHKFIFISVAKTTLSGANTFVGDKQDESIKLLESLIGKRDEVPTKDQINKFLVETGKLAFRNANDACSFTSVILSAAFPAHFIEYRQERWKYISRWFNLEKHPDKAPWNSERILYANRVAKELCETDVFHESFGSLDMEPFWCVAGLNIFFTYKRFGLQEIIKTALKEEETTKSPPQKPSSNTTTHPLNQILYGPPGTGKTYNTINYALSILEDKSLEEIAAEEKSEGREQLLKRYNRYKEKGRIEFITFHQNYAYEDFIQGLRPRTTGKDAEGGLSFKLHDGLFKEISDRALKTYEAASDTAEKYVIIIDEINRANISRVFGELITLIEEDKRSGQASAMSATLPSGKTFEVPSNLYIVGTMNTADKSIALIDIALRRRFEFVRLYPDEALVESEHQELLKTINERICKEKGPDFQIGHAYFMEKPGDLFNLRDTMNKRVIPLLYEYFMNDGEMVKNILESAGIKLQENSGLYEFTQNRS